MNFWTEYLTNRPSLLFLFFPTPFHDVIFSSFHLSVYHLQSFLAARRCRSSTLPWLWFLSITSSGDLCSGHDNDWMRRDTDLYVGNNLHRWSCEAGRLVYVYRMHVFDGCFWSCGWIPVGRLFDHQTWKLVRNRKHSCWHLSRSSEMDRRLVVWLCFAWYPSDPHCYSILCFPSKTQHKKEEKQEGKAWKWMQRNRWIGSTSGPLFNQ